MPSNQNRGRQKSAADENVFSVSSVSSIAHETEFKLGSVATSFPGGITVAVEYSDDDGSTWTYTPVDQARSAPAGYDGCVTDIRGTLQNPLSATAPDNVGTMEVHGPDRVAPRTSTHAFCRPIRIRTRRQLPPHRQLYTNQPLTLRHSACSQCIRMESAGGVGSRMDAARPASRRPAEAART